MAFDNQRKYDRYELVNKKARFVTGKKSEENYVLNISCGGVHFLSDKAYEEGNVVTMYVGDDYSTKLRVVRREDVKEALYARHAKFKIGSAFVDGPVTSDRLYEILEIFLNTRR